MPRTATHRRLRTAAAATVALTVLGGASMTTAGAAPGSTSHTSQWSHAEFTVAKRNTTVEVNIGYDDPAGARATTVAEVKVSQSWCDRSARTKVLVERELEGTTRNPFAINNPTKGEAAVLTSTNLRGTVTRTPAGTGSTCGEPTGAPQVRNTSVTALAAVRLENAAGSQPVTYSREDGGAFYYRDAAATGSLTLLELDGAYTLSKGRSAGSWFWEGVWADATGVDIVPGA